MATAIVRHPSAEVTTTFRAGRHAATAIRKPPAFQPASKRAPCT